MADTGDVPRGIVASALARAKAMANPTPTPLKRQQDRSGTVLPTAILSDKRKDIAVTDDGLTATSKTGFSGTISVRSDAPFPNRYNVVRYYEATITKMPADGCVAVGLSTLDFSCDGKLPGWSPVSLGYHSDDGGVFKDDGENPVGSLRPYKSGDTVGIGLTARNELVVTLNGEKQDAIVYHCLAGVLYYPTIGMDRAGTTVRVNFGDRPFVYDVHGMSVPRGAEMRNLPEEVILTVFQSGCLTVPDLYAAMRVSKQFHRIATDNDVWRPLVMNQWPSFNKKTRMRSFIRYYRRRHIALQSNKARKEEAHAIENCEMEFECPLLWENLQQQGGNDTVRHCNKCKQDVHFCYNEAQLDEHSSQGHCVAFDYTKPDPRTVRIVRMGKRAPPRRGRAPPQGAGSDSS